MIGMLDSLKNYIQPGSLEEELVDRIDFSRLPVHIAIIMDGNGRWALKRDLPRTEGHRAAREAVQETVEASARLGIKCLTLYAFSQENWKRPADEVETLWTLLAENLRQEEKTLIDKDLKLKVIGEKNGIPFLSDGNLTAWKN